MCRNIFECLGVEEEEKRVETNNAWKKGNGKMWQSGEDEVNVNTRQSSDKVRTTEVESR